MATAAAPRRGPRRRCRSDWRSPATTSFPIEGKLNFLDNQIDPATGTIRGRADVPQRRPEPDAGTVRPTPAPGSDAAIAGLLIQDRAVGTDLDKRFVYVVDAGSRRSSIAPSTLGPLVDGLRVVRVGRQRRRPRGRQRPAAGAPGVKVEPVIVAMDRQASGPTRPPAGTRAQNVRRRNVAPREVRN